MPGLIAVLLLLARVLPAAPVTTDTLSLTATTADVWTSGKTSIVELHGSVHIEFDHAQMTADQAVVWLGDPPAGSPAGAQRVQAALLGHVKVQQGGVMRFDQRLMIKPFLVTGAIRLQGVRNEKDDSDSAVYRAASDMLAAVSTTQTATTQAATTQPFTTPPTATPDATAVPATTQTATTQTATTQVSTTQAAATQATAQGVMDLTPATMPVPATVPSTGPAAPLTGLTPLEQIPLSGGVQPALPANAADRATTDLPHQRIELDAGSFQRAITADGKIAEIGSGGVTLRYVNLKGDLFEFTAQNMVVFTNLSDLKGVGQGMDAKSFIEAHIVSAFFDEDVQVFVTPMLATKSEMRMKAERVYYEFATDRAVMTDVLFHTVDIQKRIPIFMRAQKVRQLSVGEFKMEGVEMTTSAFSVPTYGIAVSDAYVRVEDTNDQRTGAAVAFKADNIVANAFSVPIFYFPTGGGTMTARGSPFRTIAIDNNNQFGTVFRSDWGLFQSLGMIPPKDVDADFMLNYYSDRGVGYGINGKYAGGAVDETTRQPFNFDGDFKTFFINDRGTDTLGSARFNEKPPDEFRGRAYLEHQFFFGNDVQMQVRGGYISDSNFMPQWFIDEYDNNLPLDESIYLKRSRDSEVATLLVQAQPNRQISSAYEEQTNSEVSHMPEIGYYRVGDSIADDHATFFSENTGSALKFVRNKMTLAEQGFYPGVEPGIPSYQYTGDPGDTTYRGDLRQEVDYPINAGPFKVVPYAFARYTGYSQGVVAPLNQPQNKTALTLVQVSSDRNRFMVGAGARISTDFWKVDDSVESDAFDLHRLRHIIEPELNVFTSAQSIDQQQLFIYDPQVDAVNDVTAVELALRQRWQTKRGGPGKWRNVDFFTLNLYGNFFTNQPENRFRDPTDFRGYFSYSQPEMSIPRNSANADATWRVSDTFAVLADAYENLDKYRLATASVGVAVLHDPRLSYYVGMRYIADLHSNVATLEIRYQLDKKYTISAQQSLDLAQNKDVSYSFSLIRNFDNFSAQINFNYDATTNIKGFSFGFQPFGFGRTVGSDQVNQYSAQP